MFFSIFRRYVLKKIFNEQNLILIVEIDMSVNFKNLSTFSYESIKIVLCCVFVFFRIHYLEEFLFLKFIDHDLIHQKSEFILEKFSDLDRFRFFNLFKKFDSFSFLFKLIEFDLQNRIIEFLLRRDFYRLHDLTFENIRSLIHRFHLRYCFDQLKN